MSKFSSSKEPEKGVLYCTVRWSNHNNNVNQFLSMHYAEEKYTDVVIACEGHIIKAHRMILAGCSPYFEMLFNNYEGKLQSFGQPMCIVLDGMGIAYPTLQLILEFMYGGEIRVKKSELESLVTGGVKLKVKGLDAVKLGDKQPDKPNEARTIIGRSELKPQVVKLPVPAATRVPSEPDPRKRNIETVHQAPVSNRSKSAVPRSKTPAAVARTPVSQKPVPPPMVPMKREPMDAELDTSHGSNPSIDSPGEAGQDARETVVAQRSDSPTKTIGSSPSKPLAEDRDKEGSMTSPIKSPATPIRGQDAAQADLGSRITRRSKNGNHKPASSEPAGTPTSESAATTDSEEATKMPGESPANVDARESDPNNAELSNPSDKNEGGEENGEAEAEPVSKRRVIKKPARWSDNDFVQEINIPPLKKQRKVRESPSRKQQTDENAESTPTEETPSAEPTTKKRKGVFTVFCQQYREKLQSENPGESNSEITKRLNTMWKNLDPSEKEKYCHPPKASKK